MSMMIIKCRGCKTDIEMDHPNRRFCTNCKKVKDRKHWTKKRYAEKPWYKENKAKGLCMICGNEFKGLANNRKVCGSKCRNIHAQIVRRSKQNFNTIKVNLFKSWVMWGEK